MKGELHPEALGVLDREGLTFPHGTRVSEGFRKMISCGVGLSLWCPVEMG